MDELACVFAIMYSADLATLAAIIGEAERIHAERLRMGDERSAKNAASMKQVDHP